MLAVSILGSLSVSVSNGKGFPHTFCPLKKVTDWLWTVFHASRMLELWKVQHAHTFMWTTFAVTFVANSVSIAWASVEIYREYSPALLPFFCRRYT